MPYSFNPKIIYESMTLYRFFVFASINTNKESTAPCPLVPYCPVRGTGAWASIVQLYTTIHYTQPSVAMLVGDMFSVFVVPAAAGSGGAAV